MCKEQKDFIYILEEIAEMGNMKISTKKAVNLVESVEILKKRFQNLDKSEREKLMLGSQLMYEDSAGATNLNSAIATLIISVLAAIVSTVSLIISVGNDTSMNLIYFVIASTILIWLVATMAVYSLVKVSRRSKIADNYRNTCLALIALSDDDKDGKNEEEL